MLWIFAALAVMAGSLIPIQAGVNASLRQAAGNPFFAAIANFTVGWWLLVGYFVLARNALPPVSQLAKVPWWCWAGGAMGAALVLSGVFLAHRLGAAAFIACIILGQLTSSVVLDHFGWIGYAGHPVTLMRLAGIGLLLLGAYLIHTN